MEEVRFQVNGIKWSGCRYGHGSAKLIAFHGYGQDATYFRFLGELLENRYTILAINLAFHGPDNNWPLHWQFDEEYADPWLEEVLKLLDTRSIGIMGFSIGARIGLAITSWFPEKISELWLIAPDGMPVRKAYRFVTTTMGGMFMFRRFVSAPVFTRAAISLSRRVKLLSKKVAGFYLTEIASHDQRKRLYDTWIAYRRALPDFQILRPRNMEGKLSVTGILGRDDKIIPFRRTKNMLRKIFPDLLILELDMGHNLLSEKAARKLSSFLREGAINKNGDP